MFRTTVMLATVCLMGLTGCASLRYAGIIRSRDAQDANQRVATSKAASRSSPPPAAATAAEAGRTTVPDLLPASPPAAMAENGDKKNGDEPKEKKKEEKAPEHIRDNGFLVEEAFNQEPGEVQHIFNWINFWDRTADGRTRDFAMTYTMELPIFSQKHQFSFTTQYLTAYENPHDGPPTQQGAIGDTQLTYRYQLLADDDFLWVAPRATLIVPTGDKRFGSGTGELGYQFAVAVSKYGERFDAHFNAGYTVTPGVSLPLPRGGASAAHDLHVYNLGASVYWKLKVNLHFFVEAVAVWNDEINDFGDRDASFQVIANPGVRYAICQFEDVEWVVGMAVPIGLTRDAPDIGVFVYMSIEHTFRQVQQNGKGNENGNSE